MLVYKRGPESGNGLRLPLRKCSGCKFAVYPGSDPLCPQCRADLEEGLRRANDAAFELSFRKADEKAKAGSYFNPDDPHEDRSTFQQVRRADNRMAILIAVLIGLLLCFLFWMSALITSGNRQMARQVAVIEKLTEGRR